MTSAFASRVTRSRRNLQLALLLSAAVLAAGTLRAEESPPATPGRAGPAPGQAAPAAAAPAAAEAAAPAEAPAQAASPPVPSTGPSPARFEPTEKVRADFDVPFPIDI